MMMLCQLPVRCPTANAPPSPSQTCGEARGAAQAPMSSGLLRALLIRGLAATSSTLLVADDKHKSQAQP